MQIRFEIQSENRTEIHAIQCRAENTILRTDSLTHFQGGGGGGCTWASF